MAERVGFVPFDLANSLRDLSNPIRQNRQIGSKLLEQVQKRYSGGQDPQAGRRRSG
jgi:hypothetical protein